MNLLSLPEIRSPTAPTANQKVLSIQNPNYNYDMKGMSLLYSLLCPNDMENIQIECQPNFDAELPQPIPIPVIENNNYQLTPRQNVQEKYLSNLN